MRKHDFVLIPGRYAAAEVRDFSQIIDWKTGVDFGNITPAKRLETMTGLAGNFDRREHVSTGYGHSLALIAAVKQVKLLHPGSTSFISPGMGFCQL